MMIYIALSMLLSFIFWGINIDALGNIGSAILAMALFGLLIARLLIEKKHMPNAKINVILYVTLLFFFPIFILFLIFSYKILIIISSILQLFIYFIVSLKYKGLLRSFIVFVFSTWLLSAIIAPLCLVYSATDLVTMEVLPFIILYISSISFSIILSSLRGVKYKIFSWKNIIVSILPFTIGCFLLFFSMYFNSITQTVIQYLAFSLFLVTIILLFILILGCIFLIQEHNEYLSTNVRVYLLIIDF